MRRTRQRDTREHGSSRDRGQAPVTGEAATPRRRDRVGAVHAAAGNQAVQQDKSGPKRIGEWWGGRGYREPTAEERERGFGTDDVRKAVTAWMNQAGLAPPSGNIDLADYVDVDMIISSESSTPTTSARIRVGPNGNLLPTMATIEEREPEGGYEEGSLQTATTWIQFEFHKIPDGGLYIQTSKLETERKPEGTVIETTKAADVDMSIRGREDYSLAGDERVPRSLGDMIETAGIEPGKTASGRVPASERGQSGGEPTIAVPERGVDMPPQTTMFGTGAAPFQSGLGLSTGLGTSALHRGGDTYTVEEDDDLWSIAEQQYGDAQKWPVIFVANEKGPENPNGIEDPDLIHPKQELTIPPQRRADQFDYSSWEPPADLGVGKGTF